MGHRFSIEWLGEQTIDDVVKKPLVDRIFWSAEHGWSGFAEADLFETLLSKPVSHVLSNPAVDCCYVTIIPHGMSDYDTPFFERNVRVNSTSHNVKLYEPPSVGLTRVTNVMAPVHASILRQMIIKYQSSNTLALTNYRKVVSLLHKYRRDIMLAYMEGTIALDQIELLIVTLDDYDPRLTLYVNAKLKQLEEERQRGNFKLLSDDKFTVGTVGSVIQDDPEQERGSW